MLHTAPEGFWFEIPEEIPIAREHWMKMLSEPAQNMQKFK